MQYLLIMRALIIALVLLFASAATVSAQSTQDYAVQISVSTQVAPPSITLRWKPCTFGSPSYRVFRKAKSATAWGPPIATITTGDTFYVDNSVIVDSVYEYDVVVTGSTISPSPAGYVLAGIKAPAIHSRGALILIVDSTYTDSCASELLTLMQDIAADGWQVIRHDIARTSADTSIKSLIIQDYNLIPNVKAVYLLGHIAVPYSGDLNPDAHTDHKGAWPADVYYGTIGTGWSDVSVNNATSSNPLNRNIPADGKWDQSTIPSQVVLQVGRVDLSNMPAFASTDVQRMKRYLNRAHNYKQDLISINRRGIISDNFGAFSGEAFAANAWRCFPVMVGRDSIYSLPFIPSLADSSFQWAYACGGGSYTSAGGVGVTADFDTAGAVNAIFTMMFGSYFGDWNYTNSFLRAPMCATVPALSVCWAGRPNWFFHHMALGENIGYSARITQNNTSLYQPAGYGAAGVHVALLGDPTLRTNYIRPITALSVTPVAGHGANLTWTASADPGVIGYYVYRTDSMWGAHTLISPMLTTTSWSDTVGADGLKYYMVRPVKLQSTPSGSYYNLGLGIVDTATVTFPIVSVLATQAISNISLYPNPATSRLGVTIHTQLPQTVRLSIITMSGAELFPANRQLTSGENSMSIDVSSLPSGNYFIRLSSLSGTKVLQWVKQ